MKLGFVSAILPEIPLRELVGFAREAGYACVELMCWPPSRAERRYAGVTHVDVTNLGSSQAAEIGRIMLDAQIEISGLGYYPNPLSPDRDEAQRSVDHLRKVIDAAAQLKVGVVNTFVGRDWTKSVDDNWPRFCETWQPLIAFAAERSVRVGIENCPMLFTRDEWPGGKNLATTPAIWRRMFAEIPSDHFGLNFDPSHCVWQQMDYLKPLREFRDRLVHIHAKDVRIDRDRLDDVGIMAHPLEYHVPKLPGLGEVDWGRFFSVLSDVGYRGPVCVEVEDRAYEHSLAARQSALRQSATYLKNFLAPQ
ncbi:MAG: sugar phosphate isomerase/epimerase [Planctomycetaceae bacterium]|nr:sugar phosphate isomerase/epimerase [Planctomycetaceae bacterium]